MNVKDIFPLKVSSHIHDYGMGVRDDRYKLETADGRKICLSDYEPELINQINKCVEELLNTLTDNTQ